MSGNEDELPDSDGSSRLADRAQSDFQQRAQAQRAREELQRQQREQARQRAAEQFDAFDADELRLERTDEGFRAAPRSGALNRERRRTAAESLDEQFATIDVTPEDVAIGDDGTAELTGDVREAVQRQDAAEQLNERFSEVDVAPDDVVLEDGQAALGSGTETELRRRRAASALDEQFPELDVGPSDIELGSGSASLAGEARDQLRRREAAEQFDEQLPDVDVGPDDVNVTADGASVDEQVVDRQQAEELLDETGGIPVGFNDPGAAAAEVVAQAQDVNQRLVIRDALERSGAGDLSPRSDDPLEIAAALEPDAVEASIEAFGADDAQTAPFRDRFRAPDGSVGADLDVAIAQFDETIEQRQQLAEQDPEQFLNEIDPEGLAQLRETTQSSQLREAAEFRAERDARVEAANELDGEIDAVDLDSSDIVLEDGQASLDADTGAAIERQREERAREQAAAEFEGFDADDIVLEDGTARVSDDALERERDQAQFDARQQAADQFDDELPGLDVDIDDVAVSATGSGFEATLDDAARSDLEQQQRQQAREQAAENFDSETGIDVAPSDIELEQSGESFQATLDDETAAAVGERRQDIAREITPEQPLPTGDAQQRFVGDVPPDDLDTDTRIETSTERVSVAGSGPVASLDVPGAGQDLGGLLDDAAATFDEEVTDPAAGIAQDVGEADFPVGPAGGVEGSEGRGQLARDFTTSAVGAFNVPGAAAAGVRIGDEIGQRVEPVGGPGGGITLSDPEQAEQDLEIAQDAGAAAGEFAADNPGRTGAFVAGGLAGGLAAGGAINLGRRGVSRGVGVGRRAIGNVEIDDVRPGAFLRDERGMAGGGGRMLERSVDEIEVDEFDTSSGRARAQELEIDDADELAREQARLVERDRMPPRDAFESDEAFEEALDARVARRLEQDTDDLVAPEARTTTDTAIDTRARTSAAASAPEGTALSAAAFASRAADADIGFAGAGSGGETTSAGAFDGRTTDADTAFATGALDTETTSATAFDTELNPITATGVQSDTATDVDQAFDQPTALGEPFDQPTATDQPFDQPTALDTQSDLDDALATDQAFDQVFDVDTTRTTITTRTTGRGRLRPPGLPDLEASDGGRRDPLGAIGADFENPTETLTQVDEDVSDIGDDLDTVF